MSHPWDSTHAHAAGRVQNFIAVLQFPTCTSAAQRRRSFHDGYAAEAGMKRKWHVIEGSLQDVVVCLHVSGSHTDSELIR